MSNHDPCAFVASLGTKLAARSRHVCMFLGAGTSRSCGLPDIKSLEGHVLNALSTENRAALETQLRSHDLEGALSRIRRISALIEGEDTVDGLTSDRARELDGAMCRQIIKSLGVDPEDNSPVIGLAAWSVRASYLLPVELFTVNYDLLVEEALEKLRVPYFDGFVGNLNARFQTDLVEAIPQAATEAIPPFFCTALEVAWFSKLGLG